MAVDFVADDGVVVDEDPLPVSVFPGAAPPPFIGFFRRLGRLCFGAVEVVVAATSLGLPSPSFRTNAIVSRARTADPELTTQ
jgi:hypothetical protein